LDKRRSPKKAKKHQELNTCYSPESSLDEFLQRALLWSKKIEAKNVDGGLTVEQTIKKQDKESKKEKRRLDKRKVAILDNFIFPSMANLTVFVECIAKSPYLNHMFEDDLRNLFLAYSFKVGEDGKRDVRPIFKRFIKAICMTITKDNKPVAGLDLRLVLCDIMQELIFWAMTNIGRHRFHDSNFTNLTLGPDMNRALAWTNEFSFHARYSPVQMIPSSRPPQF
jgi:hypothetical protein